MGDRTILLGKLPADSTPAEHDAFAARVLQAQEQHDRFVEQLERDWGMHPVSRANVLHDGLVWTFAVAVLVALAIGVLIGWVAL